MRETAILPWTPVSGGRFPGGPFNSPGGGGGAYVTRGSDDGE